MKCNSLSGPPGVDPYSFSEDVSMGAGGLGRGPESVMSALSQSSGPPGPGQGMVPQQSQCGGTFPPMPKKRGRKKKIRPEEEGIDGQFFGGVDGKREKVGHFKERKKHDRFNGMTEEEVQKRTLPDHLTPNLDIIIVSTLPPPRRPAGVLACWRAGVLACRRARVPGGCRSASSRACAAPAVTAAVPAP
ncbi:hypothetical protein ONE63_005709 [Megalurothrips usitatus]|uniref:Uncharacterized protein n=1 Tax=Megalurothrips usitatus TaxID=439358 RepID=A0AAV7XZK0_9NEOP|nr:hypothetical protein ONE63_005709 [Megalurothrips usitatus]